MVHIQLTIAFEWNAETSTQDIEGIRVTQLSLELVVLIAMMSMIFYIYYDYVMGIADDEESEEEEYNDSGTDNEEYMAESGDDRMQAMNTPNANSNYHETNQYTPSGHSPNTPGDHAAVTSDSFATANNTSSKAPISRRSTTGRKRGSSKAIWNDGSDDEDRERTTISRRSTTGKKKGRKQSRSNRSRSNSKNTHKQMRISITQSKSKHDKYHRTSKYDRNEDDGYNTGDAVDIYYDNDWVKAMISSTEKNRNKVTVRVLDDGPMRFEEIVINLSKDSDRIKLSVDDDLLSYDGDEYKGHTQERSGSIQEMVQEKYGAPPRMEDKLQAMQKVKKAKRRKLPKKPTFGAPLQEQKLINVDNDKNFEYYSQIPATLVLLKEFLFKFNGDKYVGIFANGSVENISKSPEFCDGIVSMVDLNGVKKLIENNKIKQHKFQNRGKGEEKHYAMIFAELIKLWLYNLSSPLLQDMPSTFFGDITSIELLEMESEKISEPNLSTLMYVWDICVLISIKSTINKMSIKRLSKIFAPYFFKAKNRERNDQIKPTIIKFCEIGIKWRKQSAKHFSHHNK